MSESSPEDLAVAFRSFARRQRDALGDTDPSVVADLSAELDGHLSAAAALLGVAADADAIGAELHRRRPDEWDDRTLAALRQHATDAGRVVRTIGERVEAAQAGDTDD